MKSFGTEEKETIKQWKKLNTEYNIAAMKYLQMERHDVVRSPAELSPCTSIPWAPSKAHS